MAKFKALQKGYDGVALREPGEIFEFQGKPGSWMLLIEGEAPAAETEAAVEPPSEAEQKPKAESKAKAKGKGKAKAHSEPAAEAPAVEAPVAEAPKTPTDTSVI